MKEKIAKIQKAMGTLQRDGEGFNSNFASLNQILGKLDPLLEKHDIVLNFPIKVVGGVNVLQAEFIEGDKEYVLTEMALPNDVNSQHLGGAITYFRRYLLVAFFNLQVEDDDGAKASKPEANTKKDGGFEL